MSGVLAILAFFLSKAGGWQRPEMRRLAHLLGRAKVRQRRERGTLARLDHHLVRAGLLAEGDRRLREVGVPLRLSEASAALVGSFGSPRGARSPPRAPGPSSTRHAGGAAPRPSLGGGSLLGALSPPASAFGRGVGSRCRGDPLWRFLGEVARRSPSSDPESTFEYSCDGDSRCRSDRWESGGILVTSIRDGAYPGGFPARGASPYSPCAHYCTRPHDASCRRCCRLVRGATHILCPPVRDPRGASIAGFGGGHGAGRMAGHPIHDPERHLVRIGQ